jgi:hypothetical protein
LFDPNINDLPGIGESRITPLKGNFGSRLALFCTICLLLLEPVGAKSFEKCDISSDDAVTAQAKKFRQVIRERFYRNLCTTQIPADVTIRFFLSYSGLIWKVEVVKSCGQEDVDNHCVDAAYCAAPLPSPPDRILKPPTMLMEPSDAGEGFYDFTFTKTETSTASGVVMYPKIPLELAYRSPNLFKLKDLKKPSNFVRLHTSPEKLEKLRFPWWMRYKQIKYLSPAFANQIANDAVKASKDE